MAVYSLVADFHLIVVFVQIAQNYLYGRTCPYGPRENKLHWESSANELSQ